MLATLRRTGPPYRVRPTEFTSALMLDAEQRQLADLLRKLQLGLPPT